jgi:hypothetical protein
MPVLFVASAAASAASILDLFYDGKAAGRVTSIFGTAGRLAEIAAARRVEQLSSAVPKVGEPFHRGAPSVLWKAAAALTAGSLAMSLVGKRRLAGVFGAAGSLCLRFAVHALSNASARDPKASFAQQRSALPTRG